MEDLRSREVLVNLLWVVIAVLVAFGLGLYLGVLAGADRVYGRASDQCAADPSGRHVLSEQYPSMRVMCGR